MKRLLAVGRIHVRSGVLVLTVAICAVMATGALAANLSGDGTIVGTTGSDSINAGNGNDTIWGLGGSDNISAGNGNDVIDGGGTCPPGVGSGVYPHGLSATEYCEHGPTGKGGNDNISAGGGSDTIWSNSGSNNINVGNGDDTVYAYGGPNNVSVGSGNDTIYAYGTGNYNVGSGTSTVYAQYSTGDTINCGSKRTTVYAVKGTDNISSNCTVDYVPAEKVPSVRRHRKAHPGRHHKGHKK